MKADAVNRWLTLVANFGVLLGIVLILVELNQNANLMRAQIVLARSEALEERSRNAVHSDYLPVIIAKRIEASNSEEFLASLTTEEYVRMRERLFADLHNLRAQVYQYRNGYIDDAYWENTVRIQFINVLQHFIQVMFTVE